MNIKTLSKHSQNTLDVFQSETCLSAERMKMLQGGGSAFSKSESKHKPTLDHRGVGYQYTGDRYSGSIHSDGNRHTVTGSVNLLDLFSSKK